MAIPRLEILSDFSISYKTWLAYVLDIFYIWPIDYSYEKKTFNKIKNGGHRLFVRIKLA